jgi:hypothetical protein
MHSMSTAGIDLSVAGQVAGSVQATFEACSKPLDFLSTEYRQNSFFRNHPLAVMPETVAFAPRLESHNGSSGFVYGTFQYVSVQKTVQSLMQNKAYVEALLHDKCKPGMLSEFADGSKCKEHVLFGDHNKLCIMLQLYYDGLGVTNPLRSHGSVHNVAVFYYTIKN